MLRRVAILELREGWEKFIISGIKACEEDGWELARSPQEARRYLQDGKKSLIIASSDLNESQSDQWNACLKSDDLLVGALCEKEMTPKFTSSLNKQLIDEIYEVERISEILEMLQVWSSSERYEHENYRSRQCDSFFSSQCCPGFLCPNYHYGYVLDEITSHSEYQKKIIHRIETYSSYLELNHEPESFYATMISANELNINFQVTGDFVSVLASIRVVIESLRRHCDDFTKHKLREAQTSLNWAHHPANGDKRKIVRSWEVSKALDDLQDVLYSIWPAMRSYVEKNI